MERRRAFCTHLRSITLFFSPFRRVVKHDLHFDRPILLRLTDTQLLVTTDWEFD